MAIFKIPQATRIDTKGLIVALDAVRDPGNLGTIIRTADWFGLDQIVVSADTASCYNPKVVQSTMGSILRVDVVVADLPELIQSAKMPIYGAVLEAAIKIKETSGVFAHGISSADFVHGPIAAVDNELPVIIFDAGGVNSEELSNLNIRLQKMGITTYTSSLDPKCSIPLPLGFSEILNSIPIIIRGQQLSYSWAIALGKNPDSPMGLSKMTLTY